MARVRHELERAARQALSSRARQLRRRVQQQGSDCHAGRGERRVHVAQCLRSSVSNYKNHVDTRYGNASLNQLKLMYASISSSLIFSRKEFILTCWPQAAIICAYGDAPAIPRHGSKYS
jgi:hypothetical protein